MARMAVVPSASVTFSNSSVKAVASSFLSSAACSPLILDMERVGMSAAESEACAVTRP